MEERCKGGPSESEEASRRPSTGVSRRAQVGCSEAVRRSVGWTAEGKVEAASGEAVGRQGYQGRDSCEGQGVSRSITKFQLSPSSAQCFHYPMLPPSYSVKTRCIFPCSWILGSARTCYGQQSEAEVTVNRFQI